MKRARNEPLVLCGAFYLHLFSIESHSIAVHKKTIEYIGSNA